MTSCALDTLVQDIIAINTNIRNFVKVIDVFFYSNQFNTLVITLLVKIRWQIYFNLVKQTIIQRILTIVNIVPEN